MQRERVIWESGSRNRRGECSVIAGQRRADPGVPDLNLGERESAGLYDFSLTTFSSMRRNTRCTQGAFKNIIANLPNSYLYQYEV